MLVIPRLVRCGHFKEACWGDENSWSPDCKITFVLEVVYCYEDVVAFMRTFTCHPNTWVEINVVSVTSEAPFQYYHQMKTGGEMAISMNTRAENLVLSAFGFTTVVVNDDVHLGFQLRRLTVVTDRAAELALFDKTFSFAKVEDDVFPRPQNLSRFLSTESLVSVSLSMASEHLGQLKAEYALTPQLSVIYSGPCMVGGREVEDLDCDPVSHNVQLVEFKGMAPQSARKEESLDNNSSLTYEMVAFRLLLNFVLAPMSSVQTVCVSDLSRAMIDKLFRELAVNQNVRRLVAKVEIDGGACKENLDSLSHFLRVNRNVTMLEGVRVDSKRDQLNLANVIIRHNTILKVFELENLQQTPVFLRALSRNEYFANSGRHRGQGKLRRRRRHGVRHGTIRL